MAASQDKGKESSVHTSTQGDTRADGVTSRKKAWITRPENLSAEDTALPQKLGLQKMYDTCVDKDDAIIDEALENYNVKEHTTTIAGKVIKINPNKVSSAGC